MCLISAVEALRSANFILGKDAYEWQMVSHDGQPVAASNGIVLEAAASIADDIDTDYLFVVASLVYNPPYRARLHSRLQHFARSRIPIGAISNGTWILARAGVLGNARCTIHWESLPAFEEEFPQVNIVNDLYVIDSNRYTSSGGLASMEMMLEMVARDHGPELARKVANNFQIDRLRNSTDRQRSGSVARLDTMPATVQNAVNLMLENLEAPLSNVELAARTNTSVRNLERLFMRQLKSSPARYYISLRLEKARELLVYTNHSTLEIALQCGFSSSSYFARCFQREYGFRPTDLRKRL